VLPDDSPDAPVPAAEAPDQLRADACPSATAASDASDAAPQASPPDAEDHLALVDAAAEKLAVPVPVAQAPDATSPRPEPQLAPSAQLDEAAGLCTRAVAQSAARSCAAKESAAQPARADAPRTRVLALKHETEHGMKLEVEPAVKRPTPKPEGRSAQPASQAAQAEPKPREAQTPASQSAKELPAEEQPAEPLGV
jgi:hypothetical protein